MSATLKIMSLVATFLVAIVLITIATGTWTLATWAEPLLPTLYFGSALFVLFVIVGAAWFLVTRRELAQGVGAEGASAEERGLQRLVAIAATVVIGVLALAVVSTWNFEGVRARLVATRVTHVQLEHVLRDPSPLVRLRACEELFQRGWVFRSNKELIAALDAHPAVAAKCLQTAQENEWKGVTSIARALNDGWAATMMGATDEPQHVCELVPWSPVLAGLGDQPAAPRLLRCALSAQSDDVRACCANNLISQGGLLGALGAPDAFDVEVVDEIFVPLVEHSFQPLSLPPGAQRVAQVLKTDDEAVRQWVVDLGCGVLDPTAAQPEVLTGLVSLVEADSCNLTPEQEAEYTAPAALGRLCVQVAASDPAQPVQQRICAGVAEARAQMVVEVARIALHQATRAPFVQEEAEFVDEGVVAYARGGGRITAEMKRKEFLKRSAVKEFGLRTYGDSPYCTRKHYDPSAPPGEQIKTVTEHCDRYEADLTVEDYLARNPMADVASKSAKSAIDDLNNGTLVNKYLRKRNIPTR